MGDGVALPVPEVRVGSGIEQVPQNSAELSGGPRAGFFGSLLGGLTVDGDVAVAFLAVFVDYFGGHHVGDIPTGDASIAEVARGEFLADVTGQAVHVGGSHATGLLDECLAGV